MKKFLIVILCVIMPQLETSYFIFTRNGFKEMMNLNFHSNNKADRYLFNFEPNVNLCEIETGGVFTTKHHIFPKSMLKSILSLSYHVENEVAQHKITSTSFMERSNSLLNIYHKNEEKIKNNERALEQLSVDSIWDWSNIFCGPQENLRQSKSEVSYGSEPIFFIKKRKRRTRINKSKNCMFK